MKGLASKETTQLINNATTRDIPLVPDRFWCKDSLSDVDDCCFWHYIFYPNGGPERDGIYHSCYAYEQEILDKMQMEKLDKDIDRTAEFVKHFCVYKATGLGLTEFILLVLNNF